MTQPDRPAKRGQRLQPTPVKTAALALSIPTIEPERLRDGYERLAAERADLFAVASYGKIVPQAVLDLVPIAFNVHPSLLPLYRGATPLQSQIRDGVVTSGVSIIAMDAGMDTGDVVAREPAAIREGETYGDLHDRFATLGATLLGAALARYAAGTLERTEQSALGSEDDAARTLTRPLSKADLRVSLAWPFERIARTIGALAPQPLARARIDGVDVKLEGARVVANGDARFVPEAPGLVRFEASYGADGEERGMVTLCAAPKIAGMLLFRAGATLVVERVIPPNKAAMPAGDFVRALVARGGRA